MSLNFEVTGIADWQERTKLEVDGRTQWHPTTSALVWLSMLVGLRGINEKNLEKFKERVSIYQVVCGPYMTDHYITDADVESHLGLTTNVSDESDAEFKRRVYEWAKGERHRTTGTRIVPFNDLVDYMTIKRGDGSDYME